MENLVGPHMPVSLVAYIESLFGPHGGTQNTGQHQTTETPVTSCLFLLRQRQARGAVVDAEHAPLAAAVVRHRRARRLRHVLIVGLDELRRRRLGASFPAGVMALRCNRGKRRGAGRPARQRAQQRR